MRSPVDSIRLDCGINRLSVSHDDRGIVAIPLDNRHIKLYDLKGSRVANLPRRNRQVWHDNTVEHISIPTPEIRSFLCSNP